MVLNKGVNKVKSNEEILKNRLIEAKDGDKKAILEIIEMYKPLVYKFSLHYFIVGYTDEDLRQISYQAILKSIKMYEVGKVGNFTMYVKASILNNLNVLVRNTMKLKGVTSLNVTNDEGFELMDNLEADTNIEEEYVYKEKIENLRKALSNFTEEEKEFILFIYSKNSGAIAEYSRIKDVDYRKCIKMRDDILKRLRNIF
ncbi:RNA polymerase sigma factor, sigma-70 family [Clostridium cavendishii DSM 21758]|uniref:RNA polymerase sigma factor, sigma-70 family n=1 Tax=Clostridium cavendishii DSM 21758 TaxID=1121302 RepID=A0A1M6QCH5_9CLOT|nr:helix-turn-helix domain-containing protein [Clostridium cavendishii]SHK17787.1 RNA polymerase sigma factor, sigma-70 family [Clostridium cavendishii DSM 21758]